MHTQFFQQFSSHINIDEAPQRRSVTEIGGPRLRPGQPTRDDSSATQPPTQPLSLASGLLACNFIFYIQKIITLNLFTKNFSAATLIDGRTAVGEELTAVSPKNNEDGIYCNAPRAICGVRSEQWEEL